MCRRPAGPAQVEQNVMVSASSTDLRIHYVDRRRPWRLVEHRRTRPQCAAHPQFVSPVLPTMSLIDSLGPLNSSDLCRVLHVDRAHPSWPQLTSGSVHPHLQWSTAVGDSDEVASGRRPGDEACASSGGVHFPTLRGLRPRPRGARWPDGAPGWPVELFAGAMDLGEPSSEKAFPAAA